MVAKRKGVCRRNARTFADEMAANAQERRECRRWGGLAAKCAMAWAVAMTVVLAGCGGDGADAVDELSVPTGTEEYVTVSLAMAGEVTVSEEPLGRAGTEGKDLYGINVYYDREKDGQSDDIYGYGLFDCVDSMRLSLLTGYTYKFVCTLVKDGKEKVYEEYSGSYSYPFMRQSSYSSNLETDLDNHFVIGTESHFSGLGDGYTHLKDEKSYEPRSCPPTERYYGETEGYKPTANGTVVINLKRCSYGVKFVVKGVTDGTLDVSMGSYANSFSVSTPEAESEGVIYTFSDVDGCWKSETDYSVDATLSLRWRRGNNVTQTLEKQQVTLKRNVMTTVTIDLNGSTGDSFIGINPENTPMTDEKVDFTIDADGQEDTEVRPGV